MHQPGAGGPSSSSHGPLAPFRQFPSILQSPHSYQAHWKQESLTCVPRQLSRHVREPLFGGRRHLGVESARKGMWPLLSANRPWGPALWRVNWCIPPLSSVNPCHSPSNPGKVRFLIRQGTGDSPTCSLPPVAQESQGSGAQSTLPTASQPSTCHSPNQPPALTPKLTLSFRKIIASVHRNQQLERTS